MAPLGKPPTKTWKESAIAAGAAGFLGASVGGATTEGAAEMGGAVVWGGGPRLPASVGGGLLLLDSR